MYGRLELKGTERVLVYAEYVLNLARPKLAERFWQLPNSKRLGRRIKPKEARANPRPRVEKHPLGLETPPGGHAQRGVVDGQVADSTHSTDLFSDDVVEGLEGGCRDQPGERSFQMLRALAQHRSRNPPLVGETLAVLSLSERGLPHRIAEGLPRAEETEFVLRAIATVLDVVPDDPG